jgi:hypothetical protein
MSVWPRYSTIRQWVFGWDNMKGCFMRIPQIDAQLDPAAISGPAP